MSLHHTIVLLLAVAGPFILVLGLDFLLGIARDREGPDAQTPFPGAVGSTKSRFRRIPFALPGARD